MADHSGQTTRERVKPVDASNTLILVCEISPTYTFLQPIRLKGRGCFFRFVRR